MVLTTSCLKRVSLLSDLALRYNLGVLYGIVNGYWCQPERGRMPYDGIQYYWNHLISTAIISLS